MKPPQRQQMGLHTGRDPDVKKPEWLRQKAPQGQRFQEVKESLSSLKLNTVCEEAQCPNIGEVSEFIWICSMLGCLNTFFFPTSTSCNVLDLGVTFFFWIEDLGVT